MYSQEFKLDEIQVTANWDLKKVVKKSAENFYRNYARFYACEMLHYRSVYELEKCVEFNALQGICAIGDFNRNTKGNYWDNPINWSYLAPLTVLRSNPLTSGGDLLEKQIIMSNHTTVDNEFFKKNYNNSLASPCNVLIKAVELFSPLNKKMIENFNYQLEDSFIGEDNHQYIKVEFCSIASDINRKSKIRGKGIILYDITLQYPQKIEMNNYMDFYSTFSRNKTNEIICATNHSICIEYLMKDDKIYPKGFVFNVIWPRENDIRDVEMYYIVPNARRNPFKYGLKQIEAIEFLNHRFLGEKTLDSLKQYMSCDRMGLTNYYCAPFIENKWKKIEYKYIDIGSVTKDLGGNNALMLQVKKNAFTAYEERYPAEDDYIEFSKKYFLIAHEILYPAIYDKQY